MGPPHRCDGMGIVDRRIQHMKAVCLAEYRSGSSGNCYDEARDKQQESEEV